MHRIAERILRLVREDEEPSDEYLDERARKKFWEDFVGRDGHGAHVIWHIWANSIEITSLEKFSLPAKPRTYFSNMFKLRVDFLHSSVTRHDIQRIVDLLNQAKSARYVQLLAEATEMSRQDSRKFSLEEFRVPAKNVVHPTQKLKGSFLDRGEFESTPVEFRMSWYSGPDQYLAWTKTRLDAGLVQDWVRDNLKRIPSLRGRELLTEIERATDVRLSIKY